MLKGMVEYNPWHPAERSGRGPLECGSFAPALVRGNSPRRQSAALRLAEPAPRGKAGASSRTPGRGIVPVRKSVGFVNEGGEEDRIASLTSQGQNYANRPVRNDINSWILRIGLSRTPIGTGKTTKSPQTMQRPEPRPFRPTPRPTRLKTGTLLDLPRVPEDADDDQCPPYPYPLHMPQHAFHCWMSRRSPSPPSGSNRSGRTERPSATDALQARRSRTTPRRRHHPAQRALSTNPEFIASQLKRTPHGCDG